MIPLTLLFSLIVSDDSISNMIWDGISSVVRELYGHLLTSILLVEKIFCHSIIELLPLYKGFIRVDSKLFTIISSEYPLD
jgi:hypothetical protein